MLEFEQILFLLLGVRSGDDTMMSMAAVRSPLVTVGVVTAPPAAPTAAKSSTSTRCTSCDIAEGADPRHLVHGDLEQCLSQNGLSQSGYGR